MAQGTVSRLPPHLDRTLMSEQALDHPVRGNSPLDNTLLSFGGWHSEGLEGTLPLNFMWNHLFSHGSSGHFFIAVYLVYLNVKLFFIIVAMKTLTTNEIDLNMGCNPESFL